MFDHDYFLPMVPNCGKPQAGVVPQLPATVHLSGGGSAADGQVLTFPEALVNGVRARDVVIVLDRGRVIQFVFRFGPGTSATSVVVNPETIATIAVNMALPHPITAVRNPWLAVQAVPEVTYTFKTVQGGVMATLDTAFQADGGELTALIDKLDLPPPPPPPPPPAPAAASLMDVFDDDRPPAVPNRRGFLCDDCEVEDDG